MNKKDKELKALRTQIMLMHLAQVPGTLMLAFGLYALFATRGLNVSGLLGNQSFIYGSILIGALIVAWSTLQLLPLLTRRAKLMEGKDGT